MRKLFVAALLFFLATTASAQTVTEIDLSIPKDPSVQRTPYWPKNYYLQNTSGRPGYVGAGLFSQFHDSAVVKGPLGTYLVITAFGLGDIFQLDGTPGPQPPVQPPVEPPVQPPTQPPVQPPPPPAGCGAITPGVNVFISYGAGGSQCSYLPSSPPCKPGEEITFNAAAFGYDFSCGPHTFGWSFGDFTAAVAGKVVSHAYAQAGQYTVTLLVGTPTRGSVQMQWPVRVGGEGPPPPPPPPPLDCSKCPQPCAPPATCQVCPECPKCPPPPAALPPCTCAPFQPVPCVVTEGGFVAGCLGPPPPPICPPLGPKPAAAPGCTVTEDDSGACPTWKVTCPPPSGTCPAPVAGQNIDLFYSGDTCSSGNGEPCDTGELVTFTAIRFPWFSCGSRTLVFDYGDGSKETTTDTSGHHRFARAGTYNVTVKVTVEGRETVLAKTVTVEEH